MTSNQLQSDSSARSDTPDPLDWEGHLERLLHVQNDDDSHTEPDAITFHPSQLAKCRRQATISKLGLEEHDTETLGVFKAGTLIHEWLEESLAGRTPGFNHEYEIEAAYDDPDGEGRVVITGHADVWDEHRGIVYDFKTRGSWYNFEPPRERHIDQLTLYMDALDASAGQVVYINKKNLEVRTWPENRTFAFDPERRDALVAKAREIRDAIRDAGSIRSLGDVPFDPCGCWICSNEGGDDDGA